MNPILAPVLALAGLFGAAALAAPAAPPGDPADVAAAPDAPPRPLIERTLVLVPERAGEFRLVGFEDYPGRPAMGVGAQYAHDDFPEVVLSLFIYPVGLHARDPALEALVEAMRGELRQVEQGGQYENLVLGDAAPIDLQRVEADGTAGPVREALVGRGDSLQIDTDVAAGELGTKLAAEVARVEEHVRAATDPDLGWRLPIRFRYDGVERQSVSYLFYRALHAFKGRVSSTMDVSPDDFARLGQRAMADIVPAVVIRNTGGCAQTTVEIDPGDEGDAAAIVMAAKAQVALVQAERRHCDDTLDESVPDGMRGLVVDVAALFGPPSGPPSDG